MYQWACRRSWLQLTRRAQQAYSGCGGRAGVCRQRLFDSGGQSDLPLPRFDLLRFGFSAAIFLPKLSLRLRYNLVHRSKIAVEARKRPVYVAMGVHRRAGLGIVGSVWAE